MRRFIALMLSAIICVSLTFSFGVTASAGLFTGTESGEMSTGVEGDGTVYWEFTYDTLKNTASLHLSGDGYMPNIAEQSWLVVQSQKNCDITELVIDEGVKSIMEGAFYGEVYLKSVVLPDSLEFMGDSAFSETGITSVILPKGLESFNGTIFNSANIMHYNVSADNPYFESVDGVVYSEDLKTLVAFPVGRYAKNPNLSFEIPKTVAIIYDYAFINSPATSYVIPGNVKTIGAQAFAGNLSLKELVLENGVSYIYDGAFLACNELKKIHLPTSVRYIGYCSFGYVYEYDYAALTPILQAAGYDIDTVTALELEYCLYNNGYTIEQFVMCVQNSGARIYAPSGSAGHNYASDNDIGYVKSQALITAPVSVEVVENGVEITWKVSSDADGYYIYRKNKKGSYVKIGEVKGVEKTTFTDKKAFASYKNTYVVRAYNEAGLSNYNKKGMSVYYVPTPKLVSAKNTYKGVKVTWEKVLTATNYNIYRKLKGDTYFEHIATVGKSKVSYIDATAENGKTYVYTVRAYDKNGVSAYNKAGVSKKYVPAPEITYVMNISTGVKLRWKGVADATGYRIYRKAENGSWKTLDILESGVYTFTDTTAKSGVKYQYAVKAINGKVMSGYYNNSLIHLSMPQISKAVSKKAGITVSYNKTNGASGYRIYRKLDGADGWTRIATVKNGSTLEYTDTTAKKGETYRYTVRAYNGSSSSYFSKTGYKIKDKY